MRGLGTKHMRNRVLLVLLLVASLFLSSCMPLRVDKLFPDSPYNSPFQINTFPVDGKYIEIIGSNGNKICYYSYDVDADYRVLQENIDIIEFDFKNLAKNTIYTLKTGNVFFSDFQKSILGISYNQMEEPILFVQSLEKGESRIYSIKHKQSTLLYSQKADRYPFFRGFFYKPNHKMRFNYLILVYPLSSGKMKVVVDSIENGHLKTLEVPLVNFTWYETNHYIWFFSETEKDSNSLYYLDKQDFVLTKLLDNVSGRIVGIDYTDDYVLVNNETKNSIDIISPKGIIGSIPINFPQENINFAVSKKFNSHYSIYVFLRTTMDGIDTLVPWIRYYPKTKKISQKVIHLPEEYELYASKYYERKNDEFILMGMKRRSREMNLLFFYFDKGKISMETLQHRVDKNMTIKRFTYHPGYYFTWSEYTKLEKFSDYNYQVYYCSLNRLKDIVERINK